MAICCYNSRDRIARTLAHVAAQVEEQTPWEVLLIDNASTDGTSDYVRSLYPDNISGRLRIVEESQQGLSFARLAAIRESRFGIISFIDDDNWIPPSWISSVEDLFHRYPEAGIIGGPSVPSFESTPPDWFSFIQGYYAVGRPYIRSGDITETNGSLLWGAGMNVKKEALIQLNKKNFSFLLSDRCESTLSTGGDTELCYAIRALGWRIRYEDSLCIVHFITSNRLTESYALKLIRGMAIASIYFELYNFSRISYYNNIKCCWWVKKYIKDIKSFLTKLFLVYCSNKSKFPRKVQLVYFNERCITRFKMCFRFIDVLKKIKKMHYE